MQHKIRRILAALLVVVLLVTMLPVNTAFVDASTSAGIEQLQEQQEDTEKSSIEQSLSEAERANTQTEKAEADNGTEKGTQEAITPQTANADATTEEVLKEDKTVEDETECTESKTEADHAESMLEVQQDSESNEVKRPVMFRSASRSIVKQQSSKVADKAPLGVILSAGAWAQGHYKWYVHSGDISRHYIFCMEKGKAMSSGIFQASKYSGVWGSAENTFRIAIAMDYFKKHGGWGSEEGYVDAQNVIWNQGGTEQAAKLLNYSNYLWKLTELNEKRSAGSDSFSNAITPITEQDAASRDARSKISANTKRVALNGKNGYDIDATIKLSGAAWKYFAGKSSMGSIEVAGCYDANGKKLEDGVANVSVDTSGNLAVQMKQKNGTDKLATTKDNAALIIMKVNPSYEGAASLDYIQTDYSKKNQTLTYDASFHSPAYFAIRVYASETAYTPTGVYVNKVDEFGKEAEGAEFLVQGFDANYLPVFSQSITDSGYVEIDQVGSYTITETKAPKGMRLYTDPLGTHVAATFHVEEQVQNGNRTLVIVPDTTFEGVVALQDANGLAYRYTIPDEYEGGDAMLHKIGNVLVAFENGKYIYQKKDLANVVFELHAAEDIYLQNELLFSADQLLTNEAVANTIWMQSGKHHTQIDEKTDLDGNLYYKDLPAGRYYLIEKETPYEGYWISGERMHFNIIDNEDGTHSVTTIHNGEGYMNEAIPARCMVIKEDEQQQRLQGAEFTIYANISNMDYEGKTLFKADQTRPVSVWSQQGVETIVENEWIPLETIFSDSNGEAYFDMELPYGHYMVAETNPPEDTEQGKRYANATETYEFWHTAKDMDALASGALFTHTFVNQEKSAFILIRKTGEQLAKAVTEQSPYGTYQKLVFENQAAEGIVFQIKDAAGNLVEELVTDESGVAKSSNLKPGTYYVKEISNQGKMKIDTQEKKVVVEADQKQTVQVETVDFMNRALNTQLQIYKQAETVTASDKLPLNDISHADDMFKYNLQPVKGVIFGVFAKEDIRNKAGVVVVKAGSCLGYCDTDDQGIATFEQRLTEGSYYYQEIRTVDESYAMDTATYPFTLQLAGDDVKLELNVKKPVINEKYKGGIKVVKTDSSSKEVLSGVRFKLYDGDKKLLGIFITDSKGEITVENLPVGTYYLEEIQTVQGYVLDSQIREIVLKKDQLHPMVNISNDQEENHVVPNEKQNENIESKSSKSGKHVKTGDGFFRYVAGIFWVLIVLVAVWCMTKKFRLFVKKMKHFWIWMLFGMLLFISGDMVQAGSIETLEVTSSKITIDGRVVTGNVTFERADGGYRMQVDSDYGTYTSAQAYRVGQHVMANDQREYVLMPVDDNQKEEKSYTLTGSRNGQQIQIPDTIQVTCRLNYRNKENVHYEDTVSLSATEIGKVEQIQYYSGMNIIIPEQSSVKRILYENQRRPLTLYDLEQIRLVSYKKDVLWEAGTIQKDIIDSGWYHRVQEEMTHNIKVYYGTSLASALTQSVTVKDNGGISQGNMLQPGYFTGTVTYHTNGGTIAKGEETQGYIRGKEYMLEKVSRKDYVFDGWYYDAGFREDKKVPVDANGNYHLPANVTQAADCQIYAKWSYDVVLKQNGITYRITPQRLAVVIANENKVEAVIPAHVIYGGQQYPVTAITADAFQDASIVSVRISKMVNEIADHAFATCVNLKEVYVDSMTLQLGNAFDKTVNLIAYAASEAYRQYEADGYTGCKQAYASHITYVLNGGMNVDANPETYEWKSNLVLEPAVKENYRFDGWYTDSGFQTEALVDHICEDTYADIVLYAKFTALHTVGETDGNGTGESGTETDLVSVKSDNHSSDRQQTTTEQGGTMQRISSIAKPWIKKLQIRVTRKKVKLKFRSENTTGYCIEYAKNKKLKKRNTIYVGKDSYTFSKWKKGKNYYLRVRPYNYDSDGNMIYGEWSRIYKLKRK